MSTSPPNWFQLSMVFVKIRHPSNHHLSSEDIVLSRCVPVLSIRVQFKLLVVTFLPSYININIFLLIVFTGIWLLWAGSLVFYSQLDLFLMMVLFSKRITHLYTHYTQILDMCIYCCSFLHYTRYYCHSCLQHYYWLS